MYHPLMLTIEQIPPECMVELTSTYAEVDMSHYGEDITPETTSHKFTYRRIEASMDTVEAIDPQTFEKRTMVHPDYVTLFMMRGIVTEDKVTVLGITATDRVVYFPPEIG